jgi:hypothetical protein
MSERRDQPEPNRVRRVCGDPEGIGVAMMIKDAEIGRLREENAALRATLAQYADKSNWGDFSSMVTFRLGVVWVGEGRGWELASEALEACAPAAGEEG